METTAPIDVVDTTAETTDRAAPATPVQTEEPAPVQPQPMPPAQSPTPAEVFRPANPVPAPAPVPVQESLDKPRRLRDIIADRFDRSQHGEDSEITTGAFAAVCAITVIVAGLAFALSFDMMLTAAKHYGWSDRLAILFPLIIDVGAVGGTFMGAISANTVYRKIGYQVLVVTLAASVLFNLVGHDIRGDGITGLPEGWAWTGTVAAVLIPMLLAYFVRAFSQALKTYTDQRRDQRREAEKQGKAGQAPSASPAPPAAQAPARSVTSKRKPSSKGKGTKHGNVATKDVAVNLGVQHRADTPAALAQVLRDAGYQLASESSIKNWCREIKKLAAQ